MMIAKSFFDFKTNMKKAAVLLLFFIAYAQLHLAAQQEVNRKLSTAEVKQLYHYSDSIFF
jgi:hypothetical protein